MVKSSVFEKIYREMQAIHFRLDDLEKKITKWRPAPIEVSESKLISLPDHLRRTYMIVAAKGECNAAQASKRTGRCRALESNYLNQLSRMGWLNKRKRSKMTMYFLTQETIKESAVKQVGDVSISVSRLGEDFKEYFADSFTIGKEKMA